MVTPWNVGVEWATGKGPRDRFFTNGDVFTETLAQHSHIENVRRLISAGVLIGKGAAPYKLKGVAGVGKYIKDYSNLFTGGLTGNIAVTYLGSYNLKYDITAIQDNLAIVQFSVYNESKISSATRPPIVGYGTWWNKNLGDPLNKAFSSGPFSKTTQTFRWMEIIPLR